MGLTGGHTGGHTGGDTGGQTGPYVAGHTGGRSSNGMNDWTKGTTGFSTEDDEGNTLAYFAPLPTYGEGAQLGSSAAANDASAATHSRPLGSEMKLPKLFSNAENTPYSHSHSRQRSDPPSEGGNTAGVPTFAPPTESPSPEWHDRPGYARQQSEPQSHEMSQIPRSGWEPQTGAAGSSHVGGISGKRTTDGDGFEILSTAAPKGEVSTTPLGLNSTADDHIQAGSVITPAHMLRDLIIIVMFVVVVGVVVVVFRWDG
jgi:hypothetical protein